MMFGNGRRIARSGTMKISDMEKPPDDKQFENPIIKVDIASGEVLRRRGDKNMNVLREEMNDGMLDKHKPKTDKNIDVLGILVELEACVEESEKLFKLTKAHQAAAEACHESLGLEGCTNVVKVIWDQLGQEYKRILTSEN